YNIIKFWPDRVEDKRVLKLGSSLSIEQTEDGGMIIGCTRELAGFERSNTFEAIDVMMKRAIRFFPALEDVDVIRFFTGFRPYTPDGRPLLGEISRLPGFYMAAGHEGDGIALAPITGKILTDLICEGHTDLDVSAFDPNRFF
ncbi:MAG: FAD-binding oxidoreductase, partial [Lachnospiraceae bacterium]|nr:FAD-binding oxidoreductase [Lachnospiraceae bacterium]